MSVMRIVMPWAQSQKILFSSTWIGYVNGVSWCSWQRKDIYHWAIVRAIREKYHLLVLNQIPFTERLCQKICIVCLHHICSIALPKLFRETHACKVVGLFSLRQPSFSLNITIASFLIVRLWVWLNQVLAGYKNNFQAVQSHKMWSLNLGWRNGNVF